MFVFISTLTTTDVHKNESNPNNNETKTERK